MPSTVLDAVLDPPGLPLPDTALLTALAIPPATQQKVLDRLCQGDITWDDTADGLVVHVPPSGSTRARARTTPRAYRVTADTCTCRGFWARGSCYHPYLWAVIDAQLHPPALRVTGTAHLTLERTLLVAALDLVRSQAAYEVTLSLLGDLLEIQFRTAAASASQITLVGRGSPAEAEARGSVAALAALITACPTAGSEVTLAATEAGLHWEEVAA